MNTTTNNNNNNNKNNNNNDDDDDNDNNNITSPYLSELTNVMWKRCRRAEWCVRVNIDHEQLCVLLENSLTETSERELN